MLLLLFVLAGAGAGWASSGFGLERTETASLKRAVIVISSVAVGFVLLVGVLGLALRVTRHYTTDDVKRAYAASAGRGTAGFVAYVSPKKPEMAVAALGADTVEIITNQATRETKTIAANWVGGDILAPEQLETVHVGYHWAGTWDGKAVTAAEVTGSLKQAPALRNIAAACPGSPYISPGNGDTYHALIWMDGTYTKVYAISFTLYPSPKTKGDSAKRLDMIVSYPTTPGVQY